MRFCMVTTFYPPYHFGGDGTYVQRLTHALAARGHQVDVIHDCDAFHLAHPAPPLPAAAEPAGVRVFPMKSPWGRLSPLLTHQTARPLLKPLLRAKLLGERYDVIHFHNTSLIGPGAFAWGNAVKLYTTHEYWLLCPLSLLWKFGRERCVAPECTRCTLSAGRPPQWWRRTGYLESQLEAIDRFIAPSRYARDMHQARGLDLPFDVLPSFVPDSPPTAAPLQTATTAATAATLSTAAAPGAGIRNSRPYFLFVGRLVTIKGLQTILDAFRVYGHADLLVAGTGEQEAELRQQAADIPAVRFLGRQSSDELRTLYREAIGLIMPSICDEVFGLVLIEAMAHGTPVIARNLAGMAEVVHDSQAGLLFDDQAGLIAAMRQLQHDPNARASLASRGLAAVSTRYSEATHLRQYLTIVEQQQAARGRA